MNTFICLLQAEVVFGVFCGHLKQLVNPARTMAFGPWGAGQGKRSKGKSCDVSGQQGQAAGGPGRPLAAQLNKTRKAQGGLGHH
jgi:hypothetical protein